MAVKLSSLAVSSTTEDGTWEASSIPDVSFKVRSINYPAFAIARDHMSQRLRRVHRDAIPPNVSGPALGRLVAKHILLDWKGFDEEYSANRALELLGDPEYAELVEAVINAAITAGSAKIEYVEEVGKNSEEPSATS